MAQHNLSCRLSRSFDAYLRYRCFRYGSLPIIVRDYHERNDGFGPDDPIGKQGKQGKDKVRISTSGSTLRVHRSGKDKFISSAKKSIIPIDSSSTEVKAANKNIVSVRADCAECGIKDSKEIGKMDFDLRRFEKTCEENNKYIRDLLHSTGLKDDNSVKVEESVSDSKIQSLKIPSHEDVQREKAKQESFLINLKPYVTVRDSKTSNIEVLRPSSHQDHVANEARRLDLKHTFSKLQTENQITPDKSNISQNHAVVSKSSQMESGTSEVPQIQSGISKANESRLCKKAETIVKETAESSASELPTILDDKFEPYIFPINTENLYDRMVSSKDKKKQSSEDRMTRLNIKIHDQVETSENKDVRELVEMDRWTKLNESKFSESSHNVTTDAIAKAKSKVPLSGTVAVLLNANFRKRMDKETCLCDKGQPGDNSEMSGEIKITQPTSLYDESDIFIDRNTENSKVIGTSKADKIESKKSSIPDSKSKKIETKSADIGSSYEDVISAEEDFNKTLGSEIIEQYAGKKVDKTSPATVKHTKMSLEGNENEPITYKMDQFKSVSSNYYIDMKSVAAGPGNISDKAIPCSVTKNIVKSESELTPGELYNSNSECVQNKFASDRGLPNIERTQFQSKSKNKGPKNKLGKKLKTKHIKKALKHTNIQEKPNFKTEKTVESKPEMGILQKDYNARSSEKQNIKKNLTQYEKQITGESYLTPGDLYNSKSEGNDTKTRPTRPRKVKKGSDFKEKLLEERLNQRSIKKESFSYELEPQNKNEPAPSDFIENRLPENRKIEYDSRKYNDNEIGIKKSDKGAESLSKDNMFERSIEAPRSKARGEDDEETLRHAKLYISKAKRLRKLAKKKSVERKNRMRSGQKKSKRAKKSEKSEVSENPSEKMTLGSFLYGLIMPNNKKGGGNQRNFTTHSGVRRSVSISHHWPLKRRRVEHYNAERFTSTANVFISPDVKRRGLGVENIKQERKTNEQRRKYNFSVEREVYPRFSSSLEPKSNRIINWRSDNDNEGNMLNFNADKKQTRRLNRMKINEEDLDIQVRGFSQKLERRSTISKFNRYNQKRSSNIFESIWQSLRFHQNRLESKIEGGGHLTTGLYRNRDKNTI